MALNFGVLAAVPTPMSGAADWADAGDEPRRLGFVHALLNVGAVIIYLLSIRARRAGQRALGVALSATGFTMASLSAWVGGDLVYGRGTNVNRNAWQPAVPNLSWRPMPSRSSRQTGRCHYRRRWSGSATRTAQAWWSGVRAW
jgi:hypothetical protein